MKALPDVTWITPEAPVFVAGGRHMYQGGYLGRVLRVNLTEGSAVEEALPPEVARNYLGGAGFGMKYLYDEVRADVDPLSAGNKLIFAPGPLTATAVPCTALMAVAAKSPLTGGAGIAITGGGVPEALKLAGWDLLILEGRAERPVFLCLDNGRAELHEADRLWGSPTTECRRLLADRLPGEGFRLVGIGPAGEVLSTQAAIISEGRGAGKGLGAVMGAKQIKVIAVRGDRSVPISDIAKLRYAAGQMCEQLKDAPLSAGATAQQAGHHAGQTCLACPRGTRRAKPPGSAGRLCDELGLDWRYSTSAAEFGNVLLENGWRREARTLGRKALGLDGAGAAAGTERAGRRRKWLEDLRTATCDCPTMCAFLLDTALADTTAENVAALVRAVTGMVFTPSQILEVGERVNNLARAFDVCAGLPAGERVLGVRRRGQSAGDGRGADLTEADASLRGYYEFRGWDPVTGIPTRACLEALGLGDVAEDLEAVTSPPGAPGSGASSAKRS